MPRVFGFDFCDFLIQFYEQQGGKESGFQFDVAGKTTTLLDWEIETPQRRPVARPRSRALVRGHSALAGACG